MATTRSNWIDWTKGIGILLVVVCHANTHLYSSPGISNLTVVCVPLLTFMAGHNGYASIKKLAPTRYNLRYAAGHIGRVLVPYLLSTVVVVFSFQRQLDLRTIWYHLLHFTATPPLYFLVFFLQLLAINQLLYFAIEWCQRRKHPTAAALVSAGFVGVLSVLCVWYTTVLDFSAGRYLFGGTFLLVYYAGMLFSAFGLAQKFHPAAIVAAAAVALYSGWHIWHWRPLLPFTQMWDNPPGLTILAYSFALCYLLCACLYRLEQSGGKNAARLLAPLALCGRYSMSIYLYHLMIMGIVVPLSRKGLGLVFGPAVPLWAQVTANIVCFILVPALPVAGALLWRAARRWLAKQLPVADG